MLIQCYHRFDQHFQPQNNSQNFSQGQKSYANMAAMFAVPKMGYEHGWYLDSGASNHVTPDCNNLMHNNEYNGQEHIHMGNGKGLDVKHVGYSFVNSPFDPKISLSLQNLLHVPRITRNLSVSKFTILLIAL